MSRTRPTDAEIAGLEFRCAYCGAWAGNWCRVGQRRTDGRRPMAKYLHESRHRQARLITDVAPRLERALYNAINSTTGPDEVNRLSTALTALRDALDPPQADG